MDPHLIKTPADIPEDEQTYGRDVWVYCGQHLAAHRTGWCTVSIRDKILLDSTNPIDAAAECKRKGFKLY